MPVAVIAYGSTCKAVIQSRGDGLLLLMLNTPSLDQIVDNHTKRSQCRLIAEKA